MFRLNARPSLVQRDEEGDRATFLIYGYVTLLRVQYYMRHAELANLTTISDTRIGRQYHQVDYSAGAGMKR